MYFVFADTCTQLAKKETVCLIVCSKQTLRQKRANNGRKRYVYSLSFCLKAYNYFFKLLKIQSMMLQSIKRVVFEFKELHHFEKVGESLSQLRKERSGRQVLTKMLTVRTAVISTFLRVKLHSRHFSSVDSFTVLTFQIIGCNA